jgi:hypothetical protein
MKRVFGTMLILPFLIWTGIRIYDNVQFNRNCGGHIKRAADANTIELATQEMTTVITYLENNNMTSGYTSVTYTTPSEDVGYWYKNLKSALGELQKVTPDTPQLTRSNVLLKLRETLLDHSSSGETVTAPDGISVFPSNAGLFWFGWFSFVMAIIGVISWILSFDDFF